MIVLAFLAISIVLVLSFASSSIMERRASSVADSSLSTELLATMVENIVQTNVRAATSQVSTRAWASQPGMIRTYNTDGSLATAFKLYSAQNPQVPDQPTLNAELAGDAAVVSTYSGKPALYTDLNKPAVFVGNPSYPIIDPMALGKVEGFTYLDKNDPNLIPTEQFTINGTVQNRPVIPMPVQWLYVLRDGQIVAPNPSDPANANGRRLTVPGADAGNPIVGRIAYWTDDETCKLNLNTAADGSYWDTPRAGDYNQSSGFKDSEHEMALFQPAQKEYQRYTGHPATTSLRPVFEKYLIGTPPSIRELLVDLSSRYTPCTVTTSGSGGSMGGTQMPNAPLAGTADPFYASTDEFYFDKTRGTRSAQLQDPAAFEQTRFFVTTSSRAPEVNLFNMPRVSLWPVSAIRSQTTRTAYDEVNLFCSTLGPVGGSNVFAFTRSDPNAVDGELSGRNLVLYDYLNHLMQTPIPGFGQSFQGKYGTDQAQILTEIYDFIRCTNICDQSMANRSAFTPFTTRPLFDSQKAIQETTGTGQVRPTLHPTNSTKGFGRFPTISEAALTIVGEETDQTQPDPADPANKIIVSQFYSAKPVLLLEFACLSQGPGGYGADFEISVAGLRKLEVNTGSGTQRLFPSDTATIKVTTTTADQNFPSWGGILGITLSTVLEKGKPYKPGNSYPLAGDPFSYTTAAVGTYSTAKTAPVAPSSNPMLNVANSNFTVSSVAGSDGIITVSLRMPKAGVPTVPVTYESIPVQTFALKFPTFTNNYPIPWISTFGVKDLGGLSQFLTLENRYWDAATGKRLWNPQQRIPAVMDTTKSLVPIGSKTDSNFLSYDLRILNAMSSVPETIFQRNFGYLDQLNSSFNSGPRTWTQRPSHNLSTIKGAYGAAGNRQSGSTGPADGAFGNLATGLACGVPRSDGYCINDLPKGYFDPNGTSFTLDGVTNGSGKPGDFDTGISFMADGPWINKPDDGDVPSNHTTPPYFGNYRANSTGQALFSPNRQVASPVQLGSLPTGVRAFKPWQTLLFCPNPAAVTTNAEKYSPSVHQGFVNPPDHLLLDLFWMPVVEPYAISDPCSTAGKVNLNTEMVPFSNIRRETALRGVLQNTQITAIPDSQAAVYKNNLKAAAYSSICNYRYPVDVDKTLAEIRNTRTNLHNNDLFLSPSQICEVLLIPKNGTTPVNLTGNPITIPANLDGSNVIGNFWASNRMTGDNLRERPYNAIYPRLTTKSNVYTIHYTVQALRKVPGTDPKGWDEGRDKVLSEQRGATTIERYIDPNDAEFNVAKYNFAARVADNDAPDLGRFYKFRTVSTRQFRQ